MVNKILLPRLFCFKIKKSIYGWSFVSSGDKVEERYISSVFLLIGSGVKSFLVGKGEFLKCNISKFSILITLVIFDRLL